MSFRAILFPSQSRCFPAQRWVNISLRTLHLIGLAGVGAGYLFSTADAGGAAYLWLIMASGLGLVLISVWSNAIWLIQLRGQAILLKLVLLAMIPLFPAWGALLFIAVIVISGLISHAPGDIRYYSIFHRKRIEAGDLGREA
jgi:hypothetical protein